MRKVLIGIILVLALIFVVLAVYVFFIKPSRTVPPSVSDLQSPEEFITESFEASENAPLKRISDRPVAGYVLDESDTVHILYADGVAEQRTAHGEPLSSGAGASGLSAQLASFSKSGEEVVFLSMDPETLEGRWYRWHVASDAPELLGQEITSALYGSNGEMFLLSRANTGEFIVSVEPPRERVRPIYRSLMPDLAIGDGGSGRILLSTQPSGLAAGILHLLNVSGGISRLAGGRHGLTGRLSSGGTWMVFSETNTHGTDLQLMARRSQESENKETMLPVLSLPERCTFVGETALYCATLPASSQSRAMPDTYYKGALLVEESEIVAVDLLSGNTQVIGSVPLNPIDLRVGPQGDILFFKDMNSGHLFRMLLGSPDAQ